MGPAPAIVADVGATPRVYINRFSCESEDSARRLVNTLLVAGLYPELHSPQLPGHAWQVVAPVSVVPDRLNLAELHEDMTTAADHAGAVFDGFDPEP